MSDKKEKMKVWSTCLIAVFLIYIGFVSFDFTDMMNKPKCLVCEDSEMLYDCNLEPCEDIVLSKNTLYFGIVGFLSGLIGFGIRDKLRRM